MRFSTALVAALPALALADTTGVSSASMTTVTDISRTTITTTCTDTAHLTKTVTLSRIHTTVSTVNSTSTVIQPTGGITHPTSSLPSASLTSGTTTPSAVPAKGPSNAGGALDAGRLAFAGVVGMVVAALL